MKVGILQFRPRLGEVEENLKAISRFLRRRKFDLAVLPELATTGYNFESRDHLAAVAETRRGRSMAYMKSLSALTGGAIVWGMAERSGDKIFNSAILTTPEGKSFIYRKTHLFYREKLIFDPGDTGFRVFSWQGAKIGLMICFDWIFPEAARTLALKGAQIICHPSNLVMPYCQRAMVTRSLENRVFCFTSNRIGREKNKAADLTFTGLSQATDIQGEHIIKFNSREEGFRVVKINPQMADTKNVNSYNSVTADRRPELYRL